MPVDLLDFDSYLNFNIKVAQVLGLHPAIYIQLLFSILKKAERKHTIIDKEYIKVDREYVEFMTTFSEEEQLKIEAVLVKLGILSRKSKNDEDLNVFKIDMNLYTKIISSTDNDYLTKLKSKVQVKDTRKSKEVSRDNKKNRIIDSLKTSIVCSNKELYSALRKWVDSVMEKPSGENWLTKEQIKTFQDKLNNYTKGDLDMALELVSIATEHGYKYFDYCKNMYENKNRKTVKQDNVRITQQQRVVSRSELSKTAF